MIRSTTRAALIALPCLLTACVVIGPTVPVTPAAGRSPAAFAEDRRACMAVTDKQVQPVANRSATASMAGRPGALSTADLQNIYDATFGQCMAARGNLVAAAPSAPRFPSDSLKNATDLDDPTSTSARKSVQDVLTSAQRSCPGERIVITVMDAPIASASMSRLVALSTPYGGTCFGQPGQNTYLLAKQGAGWTRLLSAEPGSIDLQPGSHKGYRDVQVNSLGVCSYRYAWDGSRYAQAGSEHCMTLAPPTVGTLAQAIRQAPPATGTPIACPAISSSHRLSPTETGTLFDGDPVHLMALAPNGTKSAPGGGSMNTWRLPAGGNYILACHYAGGPDLLLPLGPAAHMCQQDRTSFACR